MYYTSKWPHERWDDAHPKKNYVGHLGFWKKWQKPPFSAVSQYPDHLEGWLYWRKMLVSLYIGEKILISHIVLHYFKYKMAADVCHSIWDSSSAHRLDGPHVLYIKMIVWFPWWCTCHKNSAIWDFIFKCGNLTFTFTGHCLLLGGQMTTGHVFTVSTQEKEMPNQTEDWV